MADITDGPPARSHEPAGLESLLAPGELWRRRGMLLLALTGAMALVLFAGLCLQALREPGQTNSYALLAEAFLNGRLDVTGCFDEDCALHGGRQWVIFPPVPAVLLMPVIAVFGADFAGFVFLAMLLTAVSLWMWWRILERLALARETIVWLLLALAFATPLYYVTIRGDGVWFFAQTVAFLLVTLALHETLRGGSLVLAGTAIGLAFLSRQMSIFLLPFLFALTLRPDEPLISFRWPHWRRALALGLPVAAALIVYFVYNHVRFGSPTDTGYGYMMRPPPGDEDLISNRLRDYGLFSSAYVLFNAVYLFVQGFHVQFGGPTMTVPAAVDPAGTSLLAASPFVLLAVFVPIRRPLLVGIVMIAVMVVPMLFYHSNGFSEYNAQRYVLDWLPILFVMLALAVRRSLLPALQVLVCYAVFLNVATMVLLAVTIAE